MCDRKGESVLGILETARRTQSVKLADGMIDDLVPYWECVEEAFAAIVADEEARQALDGALVDETARKELLSSEHAPFFDALLRRYAASSHGRVPSSDGHADSAGIRCLATQFPDVAEFISHDLYEAFSVPDAYGTFDLRVIPSSCVVEDKFVGAGAVTGYGIGHGNMLLVTREDGRVTDVRYAKITETNVSLVRQQADGQPFDWDSVESPDHDWLSQMGAIPRQA